MAGSDPAPHAGGGPKARCPLQVFVRIRPLLEPETGERVAWQASNEYTLTCLEEPASATAAGTASAASGLPPRAISSLLASGTPSQQYYNRVFSESSGSEEVYREAAHPIVLAGMQGYNGTVFAYGQTGSGKTHTMRSVMRQGAAEIFSYIKGQPGREFVLRMSAMEIYNEEVRDLLVKDGGGGKGLKVMEDAVRGVHVDGLVEEGLRCRQHLEQLLQEVEARRHIRDTKMNGSSSRSHQIVRIYIESRPARRVTDAEHVGLDQDITSAPAALPPRHQSSGGVSTPSKRHSIGGGAMEGALAPVTLSVLNFVDLAGSERQAQAASEDVDQERLRQKEASNINKSLLWLGQVMRALGDGHKHIVFRDSKLTRILQHSLSGNGHMAIICTISPAAGSLENTRAALHFANTAKKVVMRPQVNEVVDDKTIIRRMQLEIEGLKQQLALTQGGSTPGPREDLSAALEAQEELVRRVAQEKEGMRRRLAGLERLILRGDGLVKERRSFDGSVDLATLGYRGGSETPEGVSSGVAGLGAEGAGRVSARRSGLWPPGPGPADIVRASWNPGSTTVIGQGGVAGPPARRVQVWGRQGRGAVAGGEGSGNTSHRSPGQLLELRLTPSVRKAVERVSEAGGKGKALTATAGEAAPAAQGIGFESTEEVRVGDVLQRRAGLTTGGQGVEIEGMESCEEGEEEEGEGDEFVVHMPPCQLVNGGGAAGTPSLPVQPPVLGASPGPPVPKLDFTRLQGGGSSGGSALGKATAPLPPPVAAPVAGAAAAVAVASGPALASQKSSTGTVPSLGVERGLSGVGLGVGAGVNGEQSLKVESALTALQAELRCIKVSCGRLPDIYSAVQSLAEEVKRLEESGAATARAQRSEGGAAATAAQAAGGAAAAGSGTGPDGGGGSGGLSVRKSGSQQQQQQQQVQQLVSKPRSEKQRLLAALKAEVSRLQQAAEAGSRADVALGALQRRLQVPLLDDEMLAAEAEATSDSLPHWLEQVLEAGEEVEGPAAPELPEQADVAVGTGAQDSAMSRRYTHADSCCSSRSVHSAAARHESQSHRSSSGGPHPASIVGAPAVALGDEGAASVADAGADGGEEGEEGGNGASSQTWCPAPGVSETPFKLPQAGEGGRGVGTGRRGAPRRSAGSSHSVGASVDKAKQGGGEKGAVEAEGQDTGPALDQESRSVAASTDAPAGVRGSREAGASEQGGAAAGAVVAGGVSGSASLGLPPGSARTPSAKPRSARRSAGAAAAGASELPPAPCASGTSVLSASGPSAASASALKAASSASLGGLDVARVRGAVTSQREAVKEWYRAELQRLHAEFTASAQREVSQLGQALEQMREHQERLELQKRLLLNQVLQLESDLDAAATRNTALEEQVQQLKIQHWEDQQRLADARRAAPSHDVDDGAGARGDAATLDVRQLSFISQGDAEWTELTPESLLPGIFDAWERLHVPLIYRSRFFLESQDKDREDQLLFYRFETQKLDLRRRRMLGVGGRSALEERASQALELERRGLAQALKYKYAGGQRERLLQEWGVNLNTKGRKLQLMRSLWNPWTTLRQPDNQGARRSALLVLELADWNATEGGAAGTSMSGHGIAVPMSARGPAPGSAAMLGPGGRSFGRKGGVPGAGERLEDVVFGSHDAVGGSRPSSQLGLAVTNLVKMVATPRTSTRRAPLPPAGPSVLSGMQQQTTSGVGFGGAMPAASAASTTTAGEGPAPTPRRTSWYSPSFLSGNRG